MGLILDLVDKIKKYYKFTNHELKGIVISIAALAFIISFRSWGTKTFDPGTGLFNLFNAFLIVALSILLRDAAERISGLYIGYRIEYKLWSFGLLFAVIVAFASNGTIWLIIPAGFLLHHLAGHRLGFFRYGINYFAQAMIALAGVLSTLMLIIFFKVLYIFAPTDLIEKAIIFNVIYAITSMLPIPPLEGSKIYFGSRMLYAFSMPAIVTASILMIVKIPVFISLVISLLVGVALWIAYYISFESKVWTGPK